METTANPSAEDLKEVVRKKYGAIAARNSSSCCGPTCGCGTIEDVLFNDDYTTLEGYNPDADLGLGCGIPTETAAIKKGDVVLDLGSGAGNDVFVARRLTGEGGKVIGVDMTAEMVRRARLNNRKLGYTNVEFRLGEIEHLPVENDSVDVVLSNCVLNLVPDKRKAFSEIKRVLKPGGHFSISDIVTTQVLPPSLQKVAELYAGCVSGALVKGDYIAIIKEAGFTEVEVRKEKEIHIPPELLAEYLPAADVETIQKSSLAILSITVYGKKPIGAQ